MLSVIETFEERSKEIDRYFKMLELFEKPGVQLHFPHSVPQHQFKNMDAEWLTTLKATAFLLIYNLIESTVREGIGAIYEKVNMEDCTLDSLKLPIRKIRISQYFKNLENSGLPSSFKEVGFRIVEDVLNDTVADLDKSKLRISGNLDAQSIRKLCDMHGMTFSKNKIAYEGNKLRLVKTKRNSLAHGDESFAECGRQHTVSELIEIKKESFKYLRGVLRNIKSYVDGEKYKIAN